MTEKRAVRYDITEIIKSLEASVVLIDGVTETVKTWNKKQECGFLGAYLAPLAASLVQPVLKVKGRGVYVEEKL